MTEVREGTPFAGNAGTPVALITGAATGLGAELVKGLQNAGWQVAAGWHRHPSPWQEPIFSLPFDVTDSNSVQQGVASVHQRFGRFDLLINNAGLTVDSLVGTMSDDDFTRVIDVNLTGAFRCARAAAPLMQHSGGGHIINISSFVGKVGSIGQSNYAAAKAGLIGFTHSLAHELGSQNIRVNAIFPGVLETRMTAKLGAPRMAELAAQNALGRLNTLQEVAAFIAYLAGTQNISGQIFQLDSRISSWS